MIRDQQLDSLKFSAIILVIFGHVIEPYTESNILIRIIYSSIYFIHMPLFAFLSGYFSKDTTLERINKGVVKLIETYLVIQFVWKIIPNILHNQFSVKSIIEPQWILWYLVSLVFWRYVAYGFKKTQINKYIIVTITIIIATIVGFTPLIGFPLSLSRTFVFLPFFIAGHYATLSDISKLKSSNKVRSVIFFTMLVTCCYIFREDYIITNKLLWGSRAYELISTDSHLYILRPVFIMISFIAIFCTFSIPVNNKLFASQGKKTMMYYIYHGLIVAILYRVINKMNIIPETIDLIGITLLIIIIICFLSSLKISSIILNPISYIYSRYYTSE